MNEKELSASRLSRILRNKSVDTDFISHLKIAYRPYMCPFDDVLFECGTEKSIFDIGCGSGMFLSLCAELLSPIKLGGVDINDKLISNTRSILSGYNIPLDVKRYDGNTIPKEIYDYDVVTIIDVLHHIPKNRQIEFLRNLIKYLRKGTKIIIKDIDADDKFVYFNKLHDFIISRERSEEISLAKLLNVFNAKVVTEEHSNVDRITTVRIDTVKKRRMLVYPHYLVVLYKI